MRTGNDKQIGNHKKHKRYIGGIRFLCVMVGIVMLGVCNRISRLMVETTETSETTKEYLINENEEKTNTTATIEYVLNGGSNSILNPTIISKDMLPITLQNPRKSGYLFGGWYLNTSCTKRIYTIEEVNDFKIYAKWNLNIIANQNVQNYPYRCRGGDLLLKDLAYSFLYALDTPGNPQTRVEDLLEQKYASEYQCPQGLCITDEYYIVSSYALEEDKMGALTLYDRDTGAYRISFGMEANSHLGGIAFDGNDLWICHSNTKEIERISYDFIKRLAELSNQNFIDITNCFQRYQVQNIPSAVACYDGVLYIATHRIYTPGMMYAYRFDGTKLLAEQKYFIPPKVQGLSFDDDGRLWVSQSYGRNQSSFLSMYDNLDALEKQFLSPSYHIEMPPGSESLSVEDGLCYVLFETASYKYYEGSDGKGTCRYPIDKILVINCDSIMYD